MRVVEISNNLVVEKGLSQKWSLCSVVYHQPYKICISYLLICRRTEHKHDVAVSRHARHHWPGIGATVHEEGFISGMTHEELILEYKSIMTP